MRFLWGFAGVLALFFGLLGIVLPLVPTVPFVLVAAWCFSHSSQRWHDWLVDHDRLGPAIRDWRRNGAISLRGKRLATLSMAVVLAVSVVLGVGARVVGVQAAVLGSVLVFIWTRPTGLSKAPGKVDRADRETRS